MAWELLNASGYFLFNFRLYSNTVFWRKLKMLELFFHGMPTRRYIFLFLFWRFSKKKNMGKEFWTIPKEKNLHKLQNLWRHDMLMRLTYLRDSLFVSVCYHCVMKITKLKVFQTMCVSVYESINIDKNSQKVINTIIIMMK